MAAETRTSEAFQELQILPDDVTSHCEACKAGILHSQAAFPQTGGTRGWGSVPGELQKATKNRVPVLLAAVIGRAMIMGRERSELRAMQASRKKKR